MKKLASGAFFVLGVALLGAAIWTVVRHGGTLEAARTAARGASPWLIAASLFLPVVNWLSTAAAIWVLTGRYGKVRPGEMAALIGAAWLLNMLPMRPGMVGRVAYHRRYNGIRVRDCVRALVAAMICTVASLALLLAAVAAAAPLNGAWGVAVLIAGPSALLAAGAVLLRGRGHTWRWPAAIGFRYLDMVTWAVRYAIVFTIIGRPIGLMGAGAMTAVGQVAMLTPVQLGLREWAVGMASTGLPHPHTDRVGDVPIRGSGGVKELVDAAAPGLLADCLMRAAELIVVVPVGLTSSAWVVRRMRAAGPKGHRGDPQESDGPDDR